MKFYGDTIRHCFGNGMEAYFLPRPGQAVEVECYIRTGSIHEGEFLGYGVSHFLEHMLFQGCAGYPEQRAAEAVRRLGGAINACTGHEYTMVNVNAPARRLDEVVGIVAAMVRTPELPKAKFVLEKQVILREVDRTRDQVSTRLIDEVLRTLFPIHPLRHPICGYPELVADCECDMLKRYHAARYTPERCFWVLTGGFDPERAAELLERRCGDWKRSSLADAALPEDPAPRTPRSGELVFPDPLARLALALRLPDDPELWDAAELLFGTLGQGESSRLVRKLELEEQLAQSVGANCFSFCGVSLGVFSAAAVPGKLKRLEKRLGEELELVRKGELDRAALEREKVQKYAELLRQTGDLRSIALNIGGAVLGGESPAECDCRIDRLAALTPEAVRQAAARLLDPGAMAVVRQLPAGSPVRRKRDLAAPKGAPELVAPDLILAADPSVPLTYCSLTMPGGTLFEGEPGASALAAAWLNCGTARRSEAEFWEKLEACGATLSINSGLNSLGVSMSAPRRYFARAIRLVGDMLRAPRFGEVEFEREREQLIEECRSRELAPAPAAIKRALGALFGGHPYGRSRGGDAAALRQLTMEQVSGFYRRMRWRDRVVTAFGGDCTAAEAAAYRDALCDGMEWSERAPELPAEPEFPAQAERIDFELPREQTAVVLALPGMRLDDYTERWIDILQNCENGLSSRLFHRVREDNALAYSVGMTLNGGFHRGSFLFYALTDEKGAERTLELLRDEATHLAETGVAEEEFLPAREAAAFEADSLLDMRGALLESAALDRYYGLHPALLAERGAALRAVTLNEFNALLRKRFAGALAHSAAAVAHGTGTGATA